MNLLLIFRRSISVLRPEITNEDTAKTFVDELSRCERKHLLAALQNEHENGNGTGSITRKLLALEASYAG